MTSQNSEGSTAGFGKDCLTGGVAIVPTDQHDMLGHKETKCSGSSISALQRNHQAVPHNGV